MPKTVLVIDTAFESCQVGVWQEDKCVTMASVAGGGKHDIVLAPLVEEIFKVHKIAVKDIEKIVVTTGPGRFTGLRVGIAFARGLALVNRTPMAGVLTSDALRWQMARDYADHQNKAVIVAVKRGESFIQRENGPIERVMDTELAGWFDAGQETLLAGMISAEAAPILKDLAHVRVVENMTEPSLEAIFAVSRSAAAEKTALIRPYYAI